MKPRIRIELWDCQSFTAQTVNNNVFSKSHLNIAFPAQRGPGLWLWVSDLHHVGPESPEKFAMGIPAHKSQQLPWGLVHQSRKRQGRTFIRIKTKSCVKWWMCGESSVLFQYCCVLCVQRLFHFGTEIKVLIIPSMTLRDIFVFIVMWQMMFPYQHFLVSCSFYESVEAERGLFGKASPISKEGMCWYNIVVQFTSSIAGVPLHFVIEQLPWLPDFINCLLWWIWGFFPQMWKRKYLLGPEVWYSLTLTGGIWCKRLWGHSIWPMQQRSIEAVLATYVSRNQANVAIARNGKGFHSGVNPGQRTLQ